MDLTQAVAKHVEWKTKLRGAINKQESMDVAVIAADNCCEFGKWLHGEAKATLGHLATYKDTLNKHAIFHKEAGKVALAINAKKFADAGKMLEAGTPYASSSSTMGVAIANFKKEAGL